MNILEDIDLTTIKISFKIISVIYCLLIHVVPLTTLYLETVLMNSNKKITILCYIVHIEKLTYLDVYLLLS